MRSTFPTGASSSSASFRCSSPACDPGEMTLIAWSTRTGVFDMTRTTGTPSGSRSSMNPVVIPAAAEITRRPGGTCGPTSSSRAPMSCGLTARISVSAVAAASRFETISMPYRSRSSAPRSSRRTVAISSDGERPARSTPDSSASPIFPAPRIAIIEHTLTWVFLTTAPAYSGGGSGPPGQGPQEEPEVRGPLRETPHEVRVPLAAVGDVHPDLRALRRETPLLLRADAVEHLVLEGAGVTVVQHRQGARDLDEPGVVRGEHRVALACHQDLHAPHERPVDLFPVGEGHRGGSGVGALAQPAGCPLVGESRTVFLCAAQVRLDDGTDVGEVAPQFVDDPQRRADGGVVLHVHGDRRPGVAGARADATGVGQGEVLVEGLPQGRQLRRHLGARTETGGAEAFQQLDVVLDV